MSLRRKGFLRSVVGRGSSDVGSTNRIVQRLWARETWALRGSSDVCGCAIAGGCAGQLRLGASPRAAEEDHAQGNCQISIGSRRSRVQPNEGIAQQTDENKFTDQILSGAVFRFVGPTKWKTAPGKNVLSARQQLFVGPTNSL